MLMKTKKGNKEIMKKSKQIFIVIFLFSPSGYIFCPPVERAPKHDINSTKETSRINQAKPLMLPAERYKMLAETIKARNDYTQSQKSIPQLPENSQVSLTNKTYQSKSTSFIDMQTSGEKGTSLVMQTYESSNNKPQLQKSSAAKVTPSEYLKELLKESYNSNLGRFDYETTFRALNEIEITKENKQRIHDTKILLIRIRPDLIPGLQEKINNIPARFISYFKESLPSFTTQAGKERFTQAVIIDTLKSIELTDKIMNVTKRSLPNNIEKNSLVFKIGKEDLLTISIEDNLETLNSLLKTYQNQLDIHTNQDQIIRWWKNIATEIYILSTSIIGTITAAAITIPSLTILKTIESIKKGTAGEKNPLLIAIKGFAFAVDGFTDGLVLGAMATPFAAIGGGIAGNAFGKYSAGKNPVPTGLKISFDNNETLKSKSVADAYKTLNLTPGANIQEIRTAYKKLAREYHPDKNINITQKEIDAKTEKFKEINEAHNFLIELNNPS